MNHKTLTLAVTTLWPLLANGFSTYWNVPSWHCYSEKKLPNLTKFQIEENSDHKFMGDKVTIFYEFTFGRYPYYRNYNESQPINGGSPLFCNLDEHLRIVEQNVTEKVSKNFTGLLILDFEEWRPLFRYNGGAKSVYQNTTIDIVKRNFSTITDKSQIIKKAAELFNAAALRFINETIHLVRELRPDARVGLYGFPYCNYNAGKNDSDFNCSATFQQFNNDMRYIYNASNALFPSIYLGFNASAEQRFRYVQAILNEANRVSRWYDPPLPIYAYTKFEYDPLRETDSFYNKSDLCSTTKQPADMGVDGLIYWSASANMKERCDHIKRYIETDLGPVNNKTVNGFADCRRTKCTDHGRCVLKKPANISLLTDNCVSFNINDHYDDYKCVCDSGYTGDNCLTKAQPAGTHFILPASQ